MSIYVLQYGDLLKIGYSSDLARRVKQIMAGIPGDVSFVGHMPGDHEVESHLHSVFALSRFAGEWFRATDDLRKFCEIALIKQMPEQVPRVVGSRHPDSVIESLKVRDAVRAFAAKTWPEASHARRMDNLALALGWRPSRVKDFYHGDQRAVLRSSEAEKLALLIAPELKHEEHVDG